MTMVTVQGTNIEDLLAEIASALRTAQRPLILIIGYNGVPPDELEVVLAAARSLPPPGDT
jgi:hypothetical protein